MRWVGLLALAGCGRFFGLDPPVTRDAIGDGETVCTNASLTCASADVLRSCAAAGELATDTQCAWGCIDAPGTTAHCGELAPSGGAVESMDLVADAALLDVTLSGDIGISSDSGQITIGNAILRAGVTGVDAGIDFQVRGTVAVFRFRSLTIVGPVIVVGSHAVAFVADGPIEVAGTVDMRGLCNNSAPGPGGFPGGGRGQDATGNGAGSRGIINEGGGGGGHGGVGGAGGTVGNPNGGPMFGGPRIPTLSGGGGGGGGGDQNNGGAGGGGGGALQIASNAHIAIANGGGINAGGCGGKAASSTGAGGGGGAGGAILLEAPVITIAGALAVNGGGGGASGGVGGDGANALQSRIPAQGGTGGGGGGGAGNGGNGAAAAARDGSPGENAQKGGGGGGAIGRMRFNTRAGLTAMNATAVLSPSLADNSTTSEATADVK